MSANFLLRKDYWRVSSYSYPNPFSQNNKAKQAWRTFETFCENSSYERLKQAWGNGKYDRHLTPHAVESWKATFEEFGLLYVVARSDEIHITEAGKQVIDAVSIGDEIEFERVGLHLLMRYPLRGPRRPKSPTHSESDLLLYRAFYLALMECGGVLYWSELERVLAKVFFDSELSSSVKEIEKLRTDPSRFFELPLPVEKRKGGFYNSLNQVVMHASMGYSLLVGTKVTPYPDQEVQRGFEITADKVKLVSDVLANTTDEKATFANEVEYFSVIGRPVQSANRRLIETDERMFLDETKDQNDLEIPKDLFVSAVQDFEVQAKVRATNTSPRQTGSAIGRAIKRRSQNAKIIGDLGEELVLWYERKKLIDAGQELLATRIVHEAAIGQTPGWDISSFDIDGTPIFIEVKATLGKTMSNLTLTANEWATAKVAETRNNYCIYIVLEANSEKGARIIVLRNPYRALKRGDVKIKLETITVLL